MSTGKRNIRVSEVMIGDIRSIDGMATVSGAAALMRRHSITSLVVDQERNVVGIVTLRDMVLKSIGTD